MIGLFEAIRIRKSGFSYRATFRVFVNSYQILVDGLSLKRQKGILADRACCLEIIEQIVSEGLLDTELCHVGTTKVFLKTNANRLVLDRQKAARVTVYAIRIQVFIRKFLAKVRANRDLYERRKEKARLEALEKARIEELQRIARLKREEEERVAKQRSEATIIIQKYWRRKMVMVMMQSMANLMELRRALADRDLNKMKHCMALADESMRRVGQKDNVLFGLFKNELKLANIMVRVMEVQDNLVMEVEIAMNNNDAAKLNKLIIKSERLEMKNHPTLILAQHLLVKLSRKRKVMKAMIAFLKDEEGHSNSILDTLLEAEQLDIDPVFIQKVQQGGTYAAVAVC